jgi:hypothetical protein
MPTEVIFTTDSDVLKARLERAGYNDAAVTVVSSKPSVRVRGLAAFAMLAMLGGAVPAFRIDPSRESCAGCGDCIPPGRAGRKCPKCRK